MLVTQSTLAHIGKLDGTLGAGIHEPVAALRMKLGGGDNFGQFFHIGGFDVDDVETLVLDVQIPKVDTEVVTTDECLAIAVDRDAVDVIGMSIGVCPTGNSSNDCVMMGLLRVSERDLTTTANLPCAAT